MNRFSLGDIVIPKKIPVKSIGGVPANQEIKMLRELTVSSYEYWPPGKCWAVTFKEINSKYLATDFIYPE